MDRTTSRKLWARIAAGDLDGEQYDGVDLHEWVRQIAVRLLDADEEANAKKRPGRILSAVGLSNKVDGYAELRELVNDVRWDFPLIVDGVFVEETHPQIIRQILELARTKGLLRGSYAEDDKQAIDRIRNLLLK